MEILVQALQDIFDQHLEYPVCMNFTSLNQISLGGTTMGNFGEYIAHAYKAFQEERFDKALEILDEAEEAYNGDGSDGNFDLEDLFMLKGSLYLFKEEYENAHTAFENALKFNPGSSDACMGLGKIFALADMKQEAKTMLEWAVVNDQESERAAHNLAEINRALGLPDEHNTLLMPEEEKEAEAVKKQQPEAAPEDNAIAEAYEHFSKKDYNEALLLLNASREDHLEKLSSIENFRGFNFLALDDIDLAEECFRASLSYNPESSQGYAGLGEVHFIKMRDKEAREHFAKALEYNPDNKFAEAGLEKVNRTLNSEEVSSGKKQMLEELIEDAYVDFNSKQFRDALKKIKKSEALIEEIGLDDKDMLTRFNNFRGFNYLGLNEVENARECFSAALKQNPKSSQGYAGLGEVLYLVDKDEDAKEMFEMAVKSNEQNQFALAGLAKVNKSLGYPEDHSTVVEVA